MHTLRLLARTPLFALTAIASLAIGIGANTAIFTAANALLLAPTAGVREMDRLVDIGRTTEGRGFDTVSYPTYVDLRDRIRAAESPFEGVYATRFEPVPLALGTNDGAERIYGEQVSPSYFEVLGVQPAAGVAFLAGEEDVAAPLRKVVLTHAFWQSHFGGRADVVGQSIALNGDSFTVVGVAARGFTGATVLSSDLWIPSTAMSRGLASAETLRGRGNNALIMVGRLKPGASIAQAQAFLDAFIADLQRQHTEVYARIGLRATPASRVPGIGSEYVAPFLAVLMGVAGLVLLVTCTNLAGLLLARAAGRSREVAVRLALGASRRALVAMLMTEAFALSAFGALAAVALGWSITRVMSTALTGLPVPLTIDLAMDWRVLAFTAGVALVTTCVTGLAPALQSSKSDLVSDLKSDASAPRRQRLRHIFITAQLAFCLVLIVVAGLFLRALGTATHVDPGMDVSRVEVVNLDLTFGDYPEPSRPDVAESLRARLGAIPGVERAGIARMVPLDGGGLGLGALRKRGTTGRESNIDTDWNVISPDYFAAMGIPLVAGRAFEPADRQKAPLVAIVNDRLARMLYPDGQALGQKLENGDFRPGQESSITTLTIVGIASDTKYRWLGERPAPFIYVPYAQQPTRELNVFLRRADGFTAPLESSVRQTLKSFDTNLPLVQMRSLQSVADLGLLPQRLAATIAGSLGLVALLLAGIGVYGVTAFAVASRTKEIGVRIALGADRARVMRMVLWQGARLAIIGGAIGLALALAASQVVTSLLFGVSPVDPVTYAVTIGALAAVTLAATFVPARRAASVDPLISLKAE
ncbi:MAG TPA: ABC transporter permease [Vicinamibacterales bacterium]|nr:ABC transporter permease [Vicinamibacterales bacterium]